MRRLFLLFCALFSLSGLRHVCATCVALPYAHVVGGSGRSYEDGYGGGGLFVALVAPDFHQYVFCDLKAHWIGPDDAGANCGIGYRLFSNTFLDIVGWNLYCDYRHITQGDFYQVGCGLELLNQLWEFRANAYLPVGQNEALIDMTEFSYSGGFFAERDRFLKGLWGGDVEIGIPLCWRCWSGYVGVGAYCYNSACGSDCCGQPFGGWGRFRLWFRDALSLGLFITHDPVFETKVQGELYWRLSFPCAWRCFQCLFFPVFRNEVILLDETCCWDANF